MTTSSHTLPSQPLSPAARAGAATGATISELVGAFARWTFWSTVFLSGLLGLENDIGLGRPASFVLMAFLGFAFVSLGEGLVELLWKLLGFLLRRQGRQAAAGRLRAFPSAAAGRILGVSVFLGGDLLWPETILRYIKLPPVGEMAILLLGVTGVLLALARRESCAPPLRVSLLCSAFLLNVAYLGWVLDPGTDAHLAPMPPPTASAPLVLPDPGRTGRYSVQTLSYGSGDHRHRSEFGEEVDLITRSVDGSQIFDYTGLAARYLGWYWGFDATRLPLNGLVWYPEGEGPFPLVLIVHGNHAATEPSDPGYAYLGEHLASHGYIAVSVDENCLNGLLFFDGGMAEMPLRAWLLLKHLQVWRGWSERPGNPFQGRVDLTRVALIGHSRGGEAVVAAAAMNRRLPPAVARASSADEFGFEIGAVVAIAPSYADERYATLDSADYLLLAGGHDADTYLLYGQAAYNRARFTHNPEGFKALVYLYQANHGNFNTVWANQDRGWLNSLLLNRRPLWSGEAQRQSARVFITAFLEASLQGEAGYRALFATPGAARSWLPAGIAVTQYADASFVPVDTNRPGTAPERLSGQPGSARQQGLSRWENTPLLLRDGATPQQNHALTLAWEAGSDPSLVIDLAEPLSPPAGGALTFGLAPAGETAGEIAVTVELQSAGGQVARLSLSRFGPVYPPLPAKLLKAGWLEPLPGYEMTVATPVERVLQTYTVPLAAFREANAGLETAAITAIRFYFEGGTAGSVLLDEIGFTRAPDHPLLEE